MELITDFDGDLKQNRSRHGMIENFAKLTLQSIKESNNKADDPPNLTGLHLSTAKVMTIIRSINFTKINQFDFIGQILLIENKATLCILPQIMFIIPDETLWGMPKEVLLL